jgi:hypothetical protein
MKRVLAMLLLGISSLLSTSCDNGGSSSSTPTSPSATLVTENFTGTVDPNGQSVNQFTVTNSGYQLNVILTAAGPPTTIYEGIGVGSYANSTCTLLTNGSTLAQAGSTAQLSYSVTVTHY